MDADWAEQLFVACSLLAQNFRKNVMGARKPLFHRFRQDFLCFVFSCNSKHLRGGKVGGFAHEFQRCSKMEKLVVC